MKELSLIKAFKKYAPKKMRGKSGDRRAAVYILLTNTQHSLEMLMVKRVVKSSDPWSGQIAFPGGMAKNTDTSLLHTAMRETSEEVGLVVDKECFLGALCDVKTHLNNVIITPHVAFKRNFGDLRLNSELVKGFWVPIEVFNNRQFRTFKVEPGVKRRKICSIFEDHVIWGASRKMGIEISKILRNFSN